MPATFQLTCVAFVRTTGGVVRLLLAIDRDGDPLFESEPVLLVEHRPGAPASSIYVEGPDAMPAAAAVVIADQAADALVALVDAAHDRDGSFDGNRLLGHGCTIVAAADRFDLVEADG